MVLAAENDETRQDIILLIVILVAIAALLALLTAWYWRMTDPSRGVAADGPNDIDADVDEDERSEATLPDSMDPIEAAWPAPEAPAVESVPMPAPVPVPMAAVAPTAPVSSLDELAAARDRRRARVEGLSDDDWSAVMRSVFDRYQP